MQEGVGGGAEGSQEQGRLLTPAVVAWERNPQLREGPHPPVVCATYQDIPRGHVPMPSLLSLFPFPRVIYIHVIVRFKIKILHQA